MKNLAILALLGSASACHWSEKWKHVNYWKLVFGTEKPGPAPGCNVV